MSGFDAKEGMIHFLFAEPDDYYLESLLKLDLMQFLYLEEYTGFTAVISNNSENLASSIVLILSENFCLKRSYTFT